MGQSGIDLSSIMGMPGGNTNGANRIGKPPSTDIPVSPSAQAGMSQGPSGVGQGPAGAAVGMGLGPQFGMMRSQLGNMPAGGGGGGSDLSDLASQLATTMTGGSGGAGGEGGDSGSSQPWQDPTGLMGSQGSQQKLQQIQNRFPMGSSRPL